MIDKHSSKRIERSNLVNWSIAGVAVLILAAALLMPLALRAADGGRAIYLPLLQRPPADDEEYYIRHYMPIYIGDIGTRILANARLPTNYSVIHTVDVGLVSSATADWEVGDYTGFYPSGDYAITQRELRGGGGGTSAVQLEGFTAGFFIRSQPPNPEFPYQLAQFYYGFDPAVHPWAYGDDAHLCVDHEAAVPYSDFAGGSINYSYVSLQLRDESTDTLLWFTMTQYDQRPEVLAKGDVVHWWEEAGDAIVIGLYGGEKYSSLLPGSARSTSDTWNDWRYFGFCVSRPQLLRAVEDANDLFDLGLSDDPDDYVMQAIGIGPEMQIEDKDKTGEMAMRLRDVRVYTILDSVE
ncbi:MAG: hypothetical protein R2851_25750 [Caldilineaceae bacterium]